MGLIHIVLYALAIIGFILVVGIIVQIKQQKELNKKEQD